MKNRGVRLLLSLLMATAFGWSANAGGTNELMPVESYTADMGKCRITLSKYGTISSLQAGGKEIIPVSFLLLHYADVLPDTDIHDNDQANQEDAAKNPAMVNKDEHAVILTKKSILGHPSNPESLLVNREIKLDDKGNLEVRFEIEYLKDVVFTFPPRYLMHFELAPLKGRGYRTNGNLGMIQETFVKEGQFSCSWGTKKIEFVTEMGLMILEAGENTFFAGYDRRQERNTQALRIDALPAVLWSPAGKYSFPKGSKQSFKFTLSLPVK